MKILIVEDQPLYAMAMQMVLQRLGDHEVTTHSTLATAECAVRQTDFDAVFIDIYLQQAPCWNLIALASARIHTGMVVAMSGEVRPDIGLTSLRFGAHSFIGKDVSIETLESILRLILGGERYVPHYLLKANRGVMPLSQREIQLCSYLLSGLSNDEISRRASLSPKSVRVYVSQLYRKLGVNNRAACVIKLAQGVVPGIRQAPESSSA